jgi:hypothetical protein
LRPIFEVLKQRRNRHSSASENPLATYTTGIAFNRFARRPIQHILILTFATSLESYSASGLRVTFTAGFGFA